MYDIVIASEKPWVALCQARFLKEKYPEASTLVFNLNRMGLLRFTYPRGGAFSDYPRVSEPEYQPFVTSATRACSLEDYVKVAERAPEYEYRNSSDWPSTALDAEALLKAIRNAKRFVFAADPSPTCAHSYHRLLEIAGVDDPRSKTDAYILYALDEKSLKLRFEKGSNAETQGYLAKLTSQGAVKRYFDWNWNQNALVVLRPALSATGIPADVTISKFELQLLYILAANPEGLPEQMLRSRKQQADPAIWTEGIICWAMKNWKGTGKYPECADFGSAASRWVIIEHLMEKKFITRDSGDNRITVTPTGTEFLSLLHPDCEDPDLPGRLNKWMDEGLSTCKPAIDRYIRTFFGKQIRFFGKVK